MKSRRDGIAFILIDAKEPAVWKKPMGKKR